MVEQGGLQAYLNGKMMPYKDARASAQSKGLQEGGLYDRARTFNGKAFKLRRHLERLINSFAFAQIESSMSIADLEEATLKVLETNLPLLSDGSEFVVTQVVSRGLASSPDETPEVNVFIYCEPLEFREFAAGYLTGARLITPTTYGVPRQGSEGTREEGEQQTLSLMSTPEGILTECEGANFMLVEDGRIKLPDRSNVLPGISMETVLELAEGLGIPIDEGEYSTYHAYKADEAFISSTRQCMLPVATINGLRVGTELPGPVTRRLLEGWIDLVEVDFVRQALDASRS